MERESLVAAALRVALKTLFECIRVRTFNTSGYQQLQVDVSFLRMMLPMYVSRDMKVLDVLCDEVLASGESRCLEPTQMEPSIIEEICRQKREKLGV